MMNGNLRTRTRLLLTLPIAAVAISLAACTGGGGGGEGGDAGGGGDTRPSAEEVSSGLSTILEDAGQGDLLTAEQLDCISEEFVDSKISDKDLQNVADGKDEQTSEDAKTLMSETMNEAAATCGATG